MRRVVLVTSLVLIALVSTASTTAALPRACGGTTATEEFPCCVSGFVTLNGEPVSGAHVTASNEQAGAEATDITDLATKRDLYPSYGFLLNGPELQAEPGDVITLSVSYQGYARSISFVVRQGEQEYDIMLDGIIAEQLRAARAD